MFSWAKQRYRSIYFIWITVPMDGSRAPQIFTSQSLVWFSYPFHPKILIMFLLGYRPFRQINPALKEWTKSAADRIMTGAGRWKGMHAVCSIRKTHQCCFGMILKAAATGKIVRVSHSVAAQDHFSSGHRLTKFRI